MNYSVLMSVYYKEKPEFLRQSMESIIEQTLQTNDFVLICDGPLSKELDNVIMEMQECLGEILNVVRLPQNVGLGRALNKGLKICKNDVIARMDSDDISYPERCEEEIKILLEKDVDIVSAAVEEFDEKPELVKSIRRPPETNKEILNFSKKRNPFNHPCVMYRKSAVERAGNYQDFYLLEDYYLWIRMLSNGSRGYNIQNPLLWMRTGNGLYKRRSGIKYAKSQRKIFKYMYKSNYISRWEYFSSCFTRTTFALIPNNMKKIFYHTFLREY